MESFRSILLLLLLATAAGANMHHPWGLVPSLDATAHSFIARKPFQLNGLNDIHAILALRGGDDDTDYEYDVEDSETEDEYDSDEEEYDSDEEEEETDSDEEEEAPTALATTVKSKAKSKSKIEDDQDHDAPLSLSPLQDMGVTLGVMVLCNKLDLTNAKIIQMAR